VVAIIGLLIAILVPAVSAVRKNAQNTVTKSTLGSIATAIDTFKADQRVGGAYPPSASDSPGGSGRPPRGWVANPYEPPRGNLDTGQRLPATGAGLLVWALAGADLLGTPGFQPVRSSSQYWSQDTNFGTAQDPGAYFLDDRRQMQPAFPRAGPYVDLSKVRVTRLNAARTSFDIPAEEEAWKRYKPSSGSGGDPVPSRRRPRYMPMFLDGFGFPILYWRADPAGVRLADTRSMIFNKQEDPEKRGIYHFGDNLELLEPSDGSSAPLILQPTNEANPHRLRYYGRRGEPKTDDPQQEEGKLIGFWKYLRNKDVSARLTPHNADSYILVSPGLDGAYGTADDIANFEHNGAETARDR